MTLAWIFWGIIALYVALSLWQERATRGQLPFDAREGGRSPHHDGGLNLPPESIACAGQPASSGIVDSARS